MKTYGCRIATTLRARRLAVLLGGISLISLTSPALAQDSAVLERLEALEDRLDALQSENAELRAQLADMRAIGEAEDDMVVAVSGAEVPPAAAQADVPGSPRVATTAGASTGPVDLVVETDDRREMQVAGSENFVGTNAAYAYKILDHAENVNTKPLVQLAALQSGELADRVTLSGGITAIANYQWADIDSKFGYLMRHPTSANQLGKNVSEVVLHSASLALTARLLPNVTGYAELLYDPEQSFGQGTITALARNQIQLRRGWVMFGNLNELPVYALVGKMDTPFGLNDTVSPFTNSTNWHAFAGLAYGGQVGIVSGGLHLRAMIIQGGAQFRSANVPVEGTNVPSRANNFAFDARYSVDLGGEGNALMAGASYQHGTAYCQAYPVFDFNPCQENNPGIAAYGKLTYGPFMLIGEYARTTKEWAGTEVPIPTNPLSVFDAVKPESFTFGGRFGFGAENLSPQRREFALSAEYSKYISGEKGSPWRRQDQLVFGASWFPAPSVNLFGEYIHVNGYVPLNFLSGGNFPDGSTWSVFDSSTDVIMAGAQVAF